MIPNDLLALLRCPADPSRTATLVVDDFHLVCTRCQARFRIRDGMPNLVLADAILPPDCRTPSDLKCQLG
jgi:hypothetical protein